MPTPTAYFKRFWRVGKNRLHFDTLNLTRYLPPGPEWPDDFQNLLKYEKSLAWEALGQPYVWQGFG